MVSEDERKWFMEAMQSQTIDVVKRMKEITQVMQTPEDVLDSQGVTPADIEGDVILLDEWFVHSLSSVKFANCSKVFGDYNFADMLDELQEHVESIDMANGMLRRLS